MFATATPLFEDRLRDAGFGRVAGVDEAGRGALAGPLVAAAVILPRDCPIQGLADSKLLTPQRRRRLAAQIEEHALAVAVVRIGPDTIDRVGLQRANISLLARALRELEGGYDYALADGFPLPRMPAPVLGVKKGDQVASCVAAASIVAKVTRDKIMTGAARRYRGYGFQRHKGYGTDEHLDALGRLGPCEIHRRSFYAVGVFFQKDLFGECWSAMEETLRARSYRLYCAVKKLCNAQPELAELVRQQRRLKQEFADVFASRAAASHLEQVQALLREARVQVRKRASAK